MDCGLPSNEPPYNEQFTNLTYISDANFIQGGKTGYIQNNSETVSVSKPNRVLRYFPDGIRNCYSLSVTQDTKYLIRTVFVYGNYDGLNSPPRFDLYLGPNIWTSLDLKNSGLSETEEIIHITRSNSLDICFVKTGTSTLLISVIELRPLPYHTYTTRTGSLRTLAHLYFSYSDKIIRYVSINLTKTTFFYTVESILILIHFPIQISFCRKIYSKLIPFLTPKYSKMDLFLK